MKVSTVALCIAFIAVAVATPLRQKRSACPAQDGNTPTYLPHETNCWLFYECSNGEAYLQSCPPGLYFDTSRDVCDSEVTCGDLSTTTALSTGAK